MLDIFSAPNYHDLTGAVGVVSGGGTGIGLMAATALASCGATVYILGRREKVLQGVADTYNPKLKGKLVAIQADMTSKDDLQRVVAEIEKQSGAVHILINNAGVEGPVTPASDAESVSEYAGRHLSNESFEAWDSLFRLNVHSVFFTTMSFLPLLEKGNRSKPSSKTRWTSTVINITSISGTVRTSQNHFGYNASKAAANHLTTMLSHELNFGASPKTDIRVNAIAPGLFPSEMTADKPAENGKSSADDLARHPNPCGKIGTEDDMAGIVVFLALNQFMYGQIVNVDGGYISAH